MRGNNEERGCSHRRRREEGGATWQSSFEIPPQSDIYSISHRQDAVIKMCQTVVRVLLDFFFFYFFFFFLWFRLLRWGSFKCETTSVGGDGENRPPPACQKTLLLLPTNKVWRIKVMINNDIVGKKNKSKLQRDVWEASSTQTWVFLKIKIKI